MSSNGILYAGNSVGLLSAYDTNSGITTNLSSAFGNITAMTLSSSGILYAATGNYGINLQSYNTVTGVVSYLGSPFGNGARALTITTAPVPESSSSAMLLAGLGMLGVYGAKSQSQ